MARQPRSAVVDATGPDNQLNNPHNPHDTPRARRRKASSSKANSRQASRNGREDHEPQRQMLPPENPIEVQEPGTSGETLNQRRLKRFYEVQAVYMEARRRYAAELHAVQDLIIQGATIQQGAYKVEYGVRLVRRPRYKQVVIDLKGEEYQQRVLESTAPHAHFRVKVG